MDMKAVVSLHEDIKYLCTQLCLLCTKETMVDKAEPIASLDKSSMFVCGINKLDTCHMLVIILSFAVDLLTVSF